MQIVCTEQNELHKTSPVEFEGNPSQAEELPAHARVRVG